MFIFFLPKSKVTTIARQSFNTGPYEREKKGKKKKVLSETKNLI